MAALGSNVGVAAGMLAACVLAGCASLGGPRATPARAPDGTQDGAGTAPGREGARLLERIVRLGADAGLDVESDAIVESTTAAAGGVRRGQTARQVASLRLSADAERLLDVPGGTAFLDARSLFGASPGAQVGDFQGISGLDAPEGGQISELWYAQRFGDQRDGVVTARLGVLDANSDFAAVEAAADFFNSSAGTSPTIVGIPSWPATAPGVELFARPESGLAWGVGLYDGGWAAPMATDRELFVADLPAGLFSIGELGLGWTPDGSGIGGPGRVALGVWHSGAEHERFDGGPSEPHTSGFYALIEQWLTGTGAGPVEDEDRGLRAFALYGRADGAVAEAEQHVMVGLVQRGTFARRDRDELGLLWSHVDLSDAPGAGFAEDESTSEVYYKAEVTETTSLQLGLQHIRNPSGEPSTDDAVALGLRLAVTF